MKLFETGFNDGYKCFERVFDTDLNKSVANPIDNRVEYYVPDPTGAFYGFVDKEVRYSPKYGKFSDAEGEAGICMPIYRNIRDNYAKDSVYNMQPRIWYLDIETRSGERFLNSPETPIWINSAAPQQTTIKAVQESGYSGDYSLNGQDFAPIADAAFMAKTPSSFPEPNLALHEVTLIQIFDNKEDTVFILGLKDVDLVGLTKRGYSFKSKVRYVNCQNELNLLNTFAALFKRLDPLVILAWNGEGFDFPYLFNRMSRFSIGEKLSNYGKPELQEVTNSIRPKWTLRSPGHYFMDFMDIYKKFTFTPQASYSLDSIAEYELKQNKVKHNEFPTFDAFYTGEGYVAAEEKYSDKLREEIRQAFLKKDENFIKLVDLQFVLYGIYDVVLLKGIDDKLKLLPLMSKISSIMGVLLNDTLKTVKPWSQYISNEAHFRGRVLPKFQEHQDPSIIGGFVKEPVPGKYNWIMNADINSMYPRLCISAFNMSPETYQTLGSIPAELRDAVKIATSGQDEEHMLKLDENYWKHLTNLLKKYNMSLGINGALFSREEVGLIPELVSKIFFQRKEMKKHMLKCYDLTTQINRILEERNVLS